MNQSAEIVICGAGIAGVSAAYHLAVQHSLKGIILVDERPPLSLTSDSSTECYRNWWPGPGDGMVALMNRSIDWMERLAEQSGNVFHLNRRGYLYLTERCEKIPQIESDARAISELGAGGLRIQRGLPGDPPYTPSPAEGFAGVPVGADLILDPYLIRKHFPYVSQSAVAALHVRRAGWFSAQQLGMYLLEQARAHGIKIVRGQVQSVRVQDGRVSGVELDNGETIHSGCFINAAGPYQQEIAGMLGVELPVYSELHQKVAFRDPLGVVKRDAPLLIWSDNQRLRWQPEEAMLLAEEPDLHWLLEEMPSGVHTRPEGGGDSPIVLMLWEYHTEHIQPIYPLPVDAQYPEIALRGLIPMLPGLEAYLGKAPRPRIDGGYYIRTRENRPLIGSHGVQGAYLIGALSGFGLMAACAAGELLAAHVTGSTLPNYASAFSLERYTDPDYLAAIEKLESTGQL